MKTSKFLLVGSVLVLIGLSIMPVLSAGAVGGPADESRPGVIIPAAQQKAAVQRWTHEAMAAATALDTMIDYGSPKAPVLALGALQLPVAGGSKAPGAPMPGSAATAKKAYPADWNGSTALSATASEAVPAAEPAGTSSVYTSYVANFGAMQTIYPHIWVGRLFFMDAGQAFSCSATALSNNTFVTAAHCVYDTTDNHYFSQWVFAPAYRNGSTPFGTFPAAYCNVLPGWAALTGDYTIPDWVKYDVAVCKASNNSSGYPLDKMVGHAGLQWGSGYVRNVHNMGYPSKDYRDLAIGSAGAYLRLCTGETFAYATDVMGEGCNWGPGMSGGPWLIGYAPNLVQGDVYSVSSGFFKDQQNLYGIRFTSANIRALCDKAWFGC